MNQAPSISPWVSNAIKAYQPPGLEPWVPDPDRISDWFTHRPPSPFEWLSDYRGGQGITAVSGKVLKLDGAPLAGVTLSIGKRSTRTDQSGRFLLAPVRPGVRVLVIDGRTASSPNATYGVFEERVDVTKGITTDLGPPVWMPALDTEHEVRIASPTRRAVTVTTPEIPGLKLKIPAGTVITDIDGNVVHRVGITPIPLDRTPFPLPSVPVPIYFTIQPGGAMLSKPAHIVYPNYGGYAPGTRVPFWYYEPDEDGWEIYGEGTVTPDARSIVPDPDTDVESFTGAMAGQGPIPGEQPRGNACCDPVDTPTGLFQYQKTDLYLPGPMPLALTRTYHQNDIPPPTSGNPNPVPNSYDFGMGMTSSLEMYLYDPDQNTQPDPYRYTRMWLIVPGQPMITYTRISPGFGWTDAVFESKNAPGIFYGSQIVYLQKGAGWAVNLLNGTTLLMGENAPLQAIRDRFGNQITFVRSGGPGGLVTQMISSDGRWISLTYSNSRITQATDNLGRVVKYTYDSYGRMSTVTDAYQSTQTNPKTTNFTWGSTSSALTESEITDITDPRGVAVLHNDYTDGRVTLQRLANGGEYTFSYMTDASGNVVATDVTDPRGTVTHEEFNASGFVTLRRLAVGTPVERTFTYQVDPATNLVQQMTDSFHNRTTAYTYYQSGNLKTVTYLSGTPSAYTYSYTYDSASNAIASITDPLDRTTSFGYTNGCLTSVTDAAGNSESIACRPDGLVASVTQTITAGLTSTTQYSYRNGDLTSVTDGLGRTTRYFVDGGGRVLQVTDPFGYSTLYTHDQLNQLTKVVDARGGVTSMTYDAIGDLLTVQDANLHTTMMTYGPLGKLATVTDPLGQPAQQFTYDASGNLDTYTDSKGQVRKYCYDRLNRVTFIGYKASGTPTCTSSYESTASLTYDGGGRVTDISDSAAAGPISQTWYDTDRLQSQTTPEGTITYTYDSAGQRQTMQVTGQPQVGYNYFANGLVSSIAQGTNTVSFTYTNNSLPLTTTLPDGIVESRTYDAAREISGISYTNSGGTSIGALSYSFDGAARLSGIYGTSARTGLPPATSAAAVYDADNRLTKWNRTTYTYDASGNLTNDGSLTYGWNARNQLTQVQSGLTVLASFGYDGLGRRESKTLSGTTTKFLYDGLNVVQELNGSGGVSASLIEGFGLDATYWRSSGGVESSVLTDALGSTIETRNQTGGLVSQYTYEPFGKPTAGEQSLAYQFAGREWDGSATGLYAMRARYYSPTLGRFISPDPLGFPGGPDPNLYAYVANDPVMVTDPLGLDPGGCGFWGFFRCVKDFFVDLWNGTSWQITGCFGWCVAFGNDPNNGFALASGCCGTPGGSLTWGPPQPPGLSDPYFSQEGGFCAWVCAGYSVPLEGDLPQWSRRTSVHGIGTPGVWFGPFRRDAWHLFRSG